MILPRFPADLARAGRPGWTQEEIMDAGLCLLLSAHFLPLEEIATAAAAFGEREMWGGVSSELTQSSQDSPGYLDLCLLQVAPSWPRVPNYQGLATRLICPF